MAFERSSVRTVCLILFMVCYVIIGAVVFMLVEKPWEEEIRDELRQILNDFRNDFSCIEGDDLEVFIAHIISANNRGVSALRNVSSDPNWTFGPSLFFAGTILTTIGYGHVTPLSEGGKIFCIVYAAVGIPLTLIMFTALVERLMILTSKLKEALNRRLGHVYKTVHIRLLHVTIIFLFLIILVFLIPSAIFMVLEENWNYLDAFYYCFISMTTVGLGDYIPGDDHGQQHRQLYKIITTMYLFMGLVCMMLTLANIYDVPELNIGYHFYMRSDEDVSEDTERTHLRTSDKPNTKYTTTSQDNAGYQNDTSVKKEQLTSAQ